MLNDRSNMKSCLDVTGTDEHTSSFIQWRVANEALFTGKRNAAIKALSKYTIENNYKKQNAYLLCCHFNQSYYRQYSI